MKYAIIHLADIHYRNEEPEGALRVITALVNDLKELKKGTLLDYDSYIAITGDIVFAGSDYTLYENFVRDFSQKLNNVGLTKDRRMIVPGNHDLDRISIEQNIASYKTTIDENIEKERKFNNFIGNHNYNKINKFENYELFESEFAKYGIDFCHGGKGWVINDDLGVYCINSALCSFGGAGNVNDESKLAVYTRGLIEWCNTTTASTKILLMHHPISYLIKWNRDEVKQIIEEHITLCLCGHTHEQNIFYNKISHKSLICSAPQVFTSKKDVLGYSQCRFLKENL
jgi:predicted MPP superfamily phosphohydrolase